MCIHVNIYILHTWKRDKQMYTHCVHVSKTQYKYASCTYIHTYIQTDTYTQSNVLRWGAVFYCPFPFHSHV